ncbi:MAG: tyrosine-type recombinase/integrase [Rectinemataceae bacterium]
MSDDLIKRWFRTMLDAIGIDAAARRDRQISFHSLRHTFVSLAREAGIGMYVVQMIARHKSGRMTELYSDHAEIIDFEEVRKKIGSASGLTDEKTEEADHVASHLDFKPHRLQP